MKSRIITYIAILATVCTGCKNFLDINPKGEVFDRDMYESAEGYEDAIYGIYAELGTNDYLYAGYAQWLPEALSQNISTQTGGLMYMASGQWTHIEANPIRNQIWSNSYTVINHINNILGHIEKGGDNEFEHTPLYKGECLALRALLHFELLKLYGAPVWADDAAKAKAIPYVTEYSFDITPFSSLDDAYDKILKDLKEAESCLAEDETLVTAQRNNAKGGFTSCRTIHMNLYAVQALMARVYWSMNDLDNASAYAKKVIDSQKFTFRSTSAFNQPDNGTIDMSETIFGVYSLKAQEKNARQYGLSGSSTSSVFGLADDYKNLYESGSGSTMDYRLAAWFDDAEKRLTKMCNRVYYRDASETYNGNSILAVNVLGIPEMYYIMAEALMTSNPAKATEYFDAVVTTRGLESLTDNGITVDNDMLYTERRKEFYGEGLHWLDMKRLGKDIVVNVTTTLPGNEVSTYQIPYPKNEDENRK